MHVVHAFMMCLQSHVQCRLWTPRTIRVRHHMPSSAQAHDPHCLQLITDEKKQFFFNGQKRSRHENNLFRSCHAVFLNVYTSLSLDFSLKYERRRGSLRTQTFVSSNFHVSDTCTEWIYFSTCVRCSFDGVA
jgi:hypothetical protein